MELWSLDMHCLATFNAFTSSICPVPGPDLHALPHANAVANPSRFTAVAITADSLCRTRSVAAERLWWWRGFIGGRRGGDHLDLSLHRPRISIQLTSTCPLSYYHNFSRPRVLQNVLCFIAWESAAASVALIRKAVMWKMKGAHVQQRGERGSNHKIYRRPPHFIFNTWPNRTASKPNMKIPNTISQRFKTILGRLYSYVTFRGGASLLLHSQRTNS